MDKRIECPAVGKKGHDSEPTAVRKNEAATWLHRINKRYDQTKNACIWLIQAFKTALRSECRYPLS